MAIYLLRNVTWELNNIMQTNFIGSMQQEEIEIDEAFLKDYWEKFAGLDADVESLLARRFFINSVKNLYEEENVLNLKTLGFKVRVKANLVKNIIIAPFLVALFQYLGTTNISATLLLNILPALIDLENVELSNEEDEIRLSLPVKKHNGNYPAAEKWYKSLPAHLQNDKSFGEFKDLLEKLVFGGLAEQNSMGKYMIFQKGKRKIKVSFV